MIEDFKVTPEDELMDWNVLKEVTYTEDWGEVKVKILKDNNPEKAIADVTVKYDERVYTTNIGEHTVTTWVDEENVRFVVQFPRFADTDLRKVIEETFTKALHEKLLKEIDQHIDYEEVVERGEPKALTKEQKKGFWKK